MSDPDRREFLRSCSVLAASLAFSCSSSGRMAASFIVNPSLDDYDPALGALIETILPIGPWFPLDRRSVERRLLRMFPLEDERKFLGLQKTLVYFDSLDLAPHVAPPLLQSERIAMDVPARMSEAKFMAMTNEMTEEEAKACDEFFARHGKWGGRFSALPPDGREAWLRIWSESRFAVKRDFARSVRAIVLVAAYSSDRTWSAIGYGGPLVGGAERSRS